MFYDNGLCCYWRIIDSECDVFDIFAEIQFVIQYHRRMKFLLSIQLFLVILISCLCIKHLDEGVKEVAFSDTIQMVHVCECDIQICCPEVEMSTREQNWECDISNKGQHI